MALHKNRDRAAKHGNCSGEVMVESREQLLDEIFEGALKNDMDYFG